MMQVVKCVNSRLTICLSHDSYRIFPYFLVGHCVAWYIQEEEPFKAKLRLAFQLVAAFVFNSQLAFYLHQAIDKNVSPKRRTPSLETVETWIVLLTLSALTTATTAIDVTVN